MTTTGVVSLELGPEGLWTDHEGLVILPNGNFLVCSEGTTTEPRLPPLLEEDRQAGRVHAGPDDPGPLRPEPTGGLTRGARGNAGFEALAISPDGDRRSSGPRTRWCRTAHSRASTPAHASESSGTPSATPLTCRHASSPTTSSRCTGRPTSLNSRQRSGGVAGADRRRCWRWSEVRRQSGRAAASENRIRIYRVTLAGATTSPASNDQGARRCRAGRARRWARPLGRRRASALTRRRRSTTSRG